MAHLSPSLAEAVDFFVMRKFVECYNQCCTVIATAKCEPEHERNQEVIEASAALGIQALAETDMWQNAVTFITDIYGSVDMCPPHIIQVCILLHAHVREYLSCHHLVQNWLENPHNRLNKQCAQVIRVFATHILHPTGCGETLKELVEGCPALSQNDRDALLKLPESGRFSTAERLSDSSKQEHFESESTAMVCGERQDDIDGTQGHMTELTHGHTESSEGREEDDVENIDRPEFSSSLVEIIYNKVSNFLKERLPPWQQRIGLLVMAVFAILSLMHSQTGDPVSSLGRLITLWRTFLTRLVRFMS